MPSFPERAPQADRGVPPNLDPKLSEAAASLAKARRDLTEARKVTKGLHAERGAADKADDAALADALAAEAPNPGRVNRQALEARIGEAEARERALGVLLGRSKLALAMLTEKNLPTWTDRARTETSKAAAEVERLVDELEAARTAFYEAFRSLQWCTEYPTKRYPVVVTPATYPGNFRVPDVLAALREDVRKVGLVAPPSTAERKATA